MVAEEGRRGGCIICVLQAIEIVLEPVLVMRILVSRTMATEMVTGSGIGIGIVAPPPPKPLSNQYNKYAPVVVGAAGVVGRRQIVIVLGCSDALVQSSGED